jgi:uncharacterized membrane protein
MLMTIDALQQMNFFAWSFYGHQCSVPTAVMAWQSLLLPSRICSSHCRRHRYSPHLSYLQDLCLPRSLSSSSYSSSSSTTTTAASSTKIRSDRTIASPSSPGTAKRHFSSPPILLSSTIVPFLSSLFFAPQLMKLLHKDLSYCLTGILLLSSFGIALEQRTMVGKALSAPLATMMMSLLVANAGVMPFTSTLYTMINQYIVPLSVPLLLFDSDLMRIFRDSGLLLLAFVVGAISTVVGTLLSYPIVPMTSISSTSSRVVGQHIAMALAARHIGGAINFVAVADTLSIPSSVISAAIAADNVVVAFYFAFLFAIAPASADDTTVIATTPTTFNNNNNKLPVTNVTVGEVDGEFELVPFTDKNKSTINAHDITLSTLGISLATSSLLVTVGGAVTNLVFPHGTSALPLTSFLTVIAATVFPKYFMHIRKAGNALGILGIQMFFAASGCAGSIRLVLQQAPSLFMFSTLQLLFHFITLMIVGRGVLHLPYRELCLASNANVGGPTTAAAMAQAKEWPHLVLPALLVGILGYATATAIALAIGPVLGRLPLLRP